MPLLLLLSALLTALTGVVAGVRPADVQVARHARAGEVARIAAAVSPTASGHAHLLGAIGETRPFAASAVIAPMLTAAPRLYLDRLRA